jgi:hypothetical protein
LETNAASENLTLLKSLNPITIVVGENTIKDYLSNSGHFPSQTVTLRSNVNTSHQFYENNQQIISSEALLMLNFESVNVKGLLILGSQKKEKFTTGQGTELLTFFANVFERTLARWLI